MWKEKFKLFLANIRILLYIVLTIAIALGAVWVWFKFDLQIVVTNMSDTTIAVLGTLLGAIVGGIFTLIGTNYLHRKTLKAQTEIKKKNLIYKPLYDELKDIQENKLTSNEYPRFVQLDNNGHDYPNMIRFSVWGRIKNDTRFLESPKVLVQEMETLYSVISDYLVARDNIGSVITNELSEILKAEKGVCRSFGNVGDILAKYILAQQPVDIFEYINPSMDLETEIGPDEQKRINDLFYERGIANEDVQKVITHREIWKKQQNRVIDLLITLITLVTKKYEE